MDAKAALERARQLLSKGAGPTGETARRARVVGPIPIVDPDGEAAGWFVPLAFDDRLVGFFQLEPDLALVRFSSFLRHPQRHDECPSLTSWTDPAAVVERARAAAQGDERLSRPRLTWDRTPTRLVWAVDATRTDGTERTLGIAGDYVYDLA